MKKTTYSNVLKVLATGLVVAALWLLTRRAATPDTFAAVTGALRQAQPADVESITLYPLLPDKQGGAARPFQLSTPAEISSLLRALEQLRPIAVNKQTFDPFMQTTLTVRLTPQLAEAWHLHSRDVIWRLASAAEGAVALRAYSDTICQSTALNQRVEFLRDSLASHWAAK
ncbi:hypothetical protein E4631_16315 [Hymenobacter sp. UV11]|uniref:hypothetical protein n=1 Tax=Hymenobacter sp. UV11 TaxID=1849735 RepID=UPI00105F5AC8|nr:hypothetical protein [Hymenobacter sp. UV11]TFZ65108.1 hypothetical protein E4631_16315 [Hymenobacter sp. UV11]